MQLDEYDDDGRFRRLQTLPVTAAATASTICFGKFDRELLALDVGDGAITKLWMTTSSPTADFDVPMIGAVSAAEAFAEPDFGFFIFAAME